MYMYVYKEKQEELVDMGFVIRPKGIYIRMYMYMYVHMNIYVHVYKEKQEELIE
jgi:hypothetical protein